MLSNGIMDYIANAQDGLQASSLRFLLYENEYIANEKILNTI
jgi:hypothetical protein